MKIRIGSLVVLLALILSSCAVSNTEQIQVAVEKTIAAIPTAIPTIMPNSIPTTAPTAVSQVSERMSEVDYLTATEIIMNDISINFTTLSDLCTAMGDNGDLITDKVWRGKIYKELDEINARFDEILFMMPPRSMEPIHTQLVFAGFEYAGMSEDMRNGIEQLDADYLQKALDHMLKGNEYVDTATAMLKN